MVKKKHGKKEAIGFAIPAGIFIGMGIGFITGELVGGLFLGLGFGFLSMMIIMLIKEK